MFNNKKTILISLSMCTLFVTLAHSIEMESNKPTLSSRFEEKFENWEQKPTWKKFAYLVPRLLENHPYLTGFIGGTLWMKKKLKHKMTEPNPATFFLFLGIYSFILGFGSYTIAREILDTGNIPTIQHVR